MSHVRREIVKVFVAPDGRRSFTKRAAYRRAAWAALKDEYGDCECDAQDYATGYPGHTCGLHDGSLDKELTDIARRLMAEDREPAP